MEQTQSQQEEQDNMFELSIKDFIAAARQYLFMPELPASEASAH